MPGKFQVVIADDDVGFCQQLAAAIAQTEQLELAMVVHDGEAALAAVRRSCPDVLVLDVVMPNLDGLGVLENLQHAAARPRILMLSAFGNEALVARALALGADYYIMKPFDMPTLMCRIAQLAQPQNIVGAFRVEQRRQRLEHEVAKHITRLGVPPHFKGYTYLREAIALVVDDVSLLERVTKALYPAIAARCHTSPNKVERAIRHAVETTCTKGNIHLIEELFAYTIDIEKGKPTNASFIARLADQVRMEMRAG